VIVVSQISQLNGFRCEAAVTAAQARPQQWKGQPPALPLHQSVQAALSQAAVSKALLIIGMFMPKFGLVPFLGTATLGAGLEAAVLLGATSVARSHDPVSWERATEKNRST